MHIKRKALYNLLRMNWQRDTHIPIEPWQVEDYRLFTEQQLFAWLKQLEICLDKTSFLAYTEQCDTPEELTDLLIEGEEVDVHFQDRVYLIIFELWRRFVHDKTCLSIFCDELDYQINRYDRSELESSEPIEDILAQLESILDENADQGGEPIEVFESLISECANDIESFLYDFIAEQIDNANYTYASDLVDGFYDYIRDVRWFDFLKVRLAAVNDVTEANEIMEQLIQDVSSQPDLDLSFEMLSFLVQGGPKPLFLTLIRQTLPFLHTEEDFQDLLNLCGDFYRDHDYETEEKQVKELLSKRAKNDLQTSLHQNDVDLENLIKIFENSFRSHSSMINGTNTS